MREPRSISDDLFPEKLKKTTTQIERKHECIMPLTIVKCHSLETLL